MKIKSFQGGYDNNLSYLVWCEITKQAAIIDASIDILEIISDIKEKKLTLRYLNLLKVIKKR